MPLNAMKPRKDHDPETASLASESVSRRTDAVGKVMVQPLDYSFGMVSARGNPVSIKQAVTQQRAKGATIVYAIRSTG